MPDCVYKRDNGTWILQKSCNDKHVTGECDGLPNSKSKEPGSQVVGADKEAAFQMKFAQAIGNSNPDAFKFKQDDTLTLKCIVGVGSKEMHYTSEGVTLTNLKLSATGEPVAQATT